MVDTDGDGEIDRIYLADTNGVLYKVNTAKNQVCPIAKTGEALFAPIAVDSSTSGTVRVFVAGGGNPKLGAALGSSYHLFAYQDRDVVGSCSSATLLFSQSLPAGHRVWAAPVITGSEVYVASATTNILDQCATADPQNPGALFGYSTTPNAGGQARQVINRTPFGGSNAVGGLRAFDGHLFVTSLDGSVTLFGQTKWNNAPVGNGGGIGTGLTFPTAMWSEQ